MAAPDLPPPPAEPVDRPTTVHLHPGRLDASAMPGAVAIVIDQLRASVTIAAALAAGATFVEPVLTVEEARIRAQAHRARGTPTLLGGERGGLAVEGFDLGNSPGAYQPQRIGGHALVFTTTNGTAALWRVATAALVIVGSLANRRAVVDALTDDPRHLHILCCGTRDEVTLEDVLAAGAFVEALTERGRGLSSDDSSRLALIAWRDARARGVEAAMREARGGRNLIRQGLGADIALCARADWLNVVPRFTASAGNASGGDAGGGVIVC